MSNVKAQSSNKTRNPNVLKKFDIKPFVIDLAFGFWHLTFMVRKIIAVPVIEL
jgi:hypothetical protein